MNSCKGRLRSISRSILPAALVAAILLAFAAPPPAAAQTLELEVRNVTHDAETLEGVAWTHPASSDDLHAEDPPSQALMDLSDSSNVLPFAQFVESRSGTYGLVFVEGLMPGQRTAIRIPALGSSYRIGYSVLLPFRGGGYAYLAAHVRRLDPPAREIVHAWESMGFRHLPRATHIHRARSGPVLQTVAEWTVRESESDPVPRSAPCPSWESGHC